MKCGIVGLPNVGKSSLFNALSNAGAEAANFPFCTIDPNVGIVPVPDKRLDELTRIAKPKKTTPAIIEFVDIAGLVKGASEGKGKGNAFLSHIREVDLLVHVVRCFDDPNVIHVEGNIDPARDIMIINQELLLKDLESIEKREVRARSAAKGGQDKAAKLALDVIERLKTHVENGNMVITFPANEEEKATFADLFLLTAKRMVYACNVPESDLPDGAQSKEVKIVRDIAAKEGNSVVIFCAKIEAEIAELEEDEKRMFLEELGIHDTGLDRLIQTAYRELGLITYFTVGEKEVRSWTIPVGCKAPQAAGVIHTDFERGFIRAETIKYADFVVYKSEAAAKEAGKMRSEGKEYVVEDGDIMLFRFNV